MTSPQAWLVGLIAAIAATGGAYLQGRSDGGNRCQADQAREERVAQIAGAAAAASAAEAISRIEVKHATIRQTLQREIIEKPVYRDCHSGMDAVGVFNSAILPATAASSTTDPRELPAAHPAAR
jgi:hypothetical protein